MDSFLMAAITGISPSLYESAVIDGANEWQCTWKITVPMLILCMTNLGFGVSTFFKNLFDSDRRRLALIQLGGFSPVLICIVIDGVLRIMDNTEPWPFITIFGWHISIVAFLIILSIRFAGTYKMNEKL